MKVAILMRHAIVSHLIELSISKDSFSDHQKAISVRPLHRRNVVGGVED